MLPRSKVVRETVVLYFNRYKTIMAEVIQQGMDSGEFKAGDPETIAISVIGMYEGIAMLWFIKPELVDWDRMGPEPIELLLAGLTMGQG